MLRNTAYLGLAEVLVIPISLILNGLMGRYLGPEDMGHLYLGMTITKFAFLAVDWGHGGSLPAAVVLDKSIAGKLLGSSLIWRSCASVAAYAVVAVGCQVLGYNEKQQWVIGLTFMASMVASFLSAFQDVVRGFERTDVAAYSRVGSQLMMVLLVIPVLLLGGRLRLAIVAQAVSTLVVLLVVIRTIRKIGVGPLGWQRDVFNKLMAGGTPFVFFGLALALQPNIDAFYLAKLSTPEVMGWYAVSQRLVGFLVLPAITLIGALYPTLCRLYATDTPGYQRTARNAISAVTLLVFPVALGCALYPDVGVSIFGREAFRPAEDTLRLFAIFLFLLYFSMPLGTALVAAGKQRAWALLQLVCVANSAVLDPFLIEYFQERNGNGSLGLAVASAISEGCMITGALFLVPRGVLTRELFKTLGLALLSGVAMAATALGLRFLPSLVGAVASSLVYALALVLTGAVTQQQKEAILGFVRRKLARGRA